MDEKTKRKISRALKGRPKPPRSEEHRKNLSKAFKGRSYIERFGKERSTKIITKRSAKLKGQKRIFKNPETWRRNLSHSLKGRQAWNKGKKGLQKAWNKIEIPKYLLHELYVLKGKVTSDVAEEFNVSKSTIRRAARKYNFPLRTNSKLLKGKTLEEVYGKERAEEIKKKLSSASTGRTITWGDKISKGLREYYKFNEYPIESRKKFSELMRIIWKQPEYREKVIASHRRYLEEHPEELIRLRKIQYPGRQTKIELRVREFLNQFFEENKDFYYDKQDKTKQTFFRPDFQFPDKSIIIELDGYYKHFTEEGVKKDKAREKELKSAGWQIYRFTQKEIDRNFEEVKSRIISILS